MEAMEEKVNELVQAVNGLISERAAGHQLRSPVHVVQDHIDGNEITTPARSTTISVDEHSDTSNIDLGEYKIPSIPIVHEKAQFTAGLPIGAQTPESLKKRIWERKFVEFSSLLNPDADDAYALSVNNQNKSPTFSLTPKRKPSISEDEWNRAFDIYLAIYVQRYPKELQDLLSYGNNIRNMMRNKQNWNYYDRQFRLARQHSLCAWTTIRVDLLLHSPGLQQSKSGTGRFFHFSNGAIPRGFCFAFHSREARCYIRNCPYRH